MPELPEVETVRRGLAPALEGRRLERVTLGRPDLRFPFPDDFVARLEGRRIERLDRRAKYLLARLDSDETLLMHLGMTGRFSIEAEAGVDQPGDFVHAAPADPKHDHVVFHAEGGVTVRYNDARRFGYMDLSPGHDDVRNPHVANLGPEPDGNDFSAAYLDEALAGRKTPIKSALLDQGIVAGLGNIYVCEALFRARISPRRSAATVTGQRAGRLAPAVRDVIREAIDAGGSTLRDFAATDGALGYFQHRFQVYGREGEACVSDGCTGQIRRLVQSGRSSFYCPNCQR